MRFSQAAALGLLSLACNHLLLGEAFAFGGARVALSSARATRTGTALRAKPRGDRKFVINKSGALDDDGIIELDMRTNTKKVVEKAQPAQKMKPGDVPVGKVELYCKAGADGKSLGDCPFAQYVSMVLQLKNIPHKVIPCAPDAKPDWLLEDYDGKMPCLVHDGEAYTDSHEIATYLDYFFPEPALKDPAKDPQSKAAFEAASGLFPALAKCIKNLDKAEDEKLVNGVMAELKKIDAHLGSSGGDYLGGASIGLVDCSVAPKLYHAKGTLAHFKNAVIDPDFENLHRYMTTMFSHPAFKASQYPVDVAIWGWNNARGTSAA